MKHALNIALITLATVYFAVAAYPSLKHGACLLQSDIAPTTSQRVAAIADRPVCPQP